LKDQGKPGIGGFTTVVALSVVAVLFLRQLKGTAVKNNQPTAGDIDTQKRSSGKNYYGKSFPGCCDTCNKNDFYGHLKASRGQEDPKSTQTHTYIQTHTHIYIHSGMNDACYV